MSAGLDALIGVDQFLTRREDSGRLFDGTLFEDVSDVELACLYQSGGAHLHDAIYCELHLRGITPWHIVSCPPLELAL